MKNDYTKEENAVLVIENNIMQFKKSIVQLSNISSLTISPMQKTDYPIWAFIFVLAGLIILSENVMLGLIAIAIGAGVLIYIYQKNTALGSYLVVNLNSGDKFYFSCKDEEFLLKAEKAISKCFNNRGRSVISFQNCNIDSSQIGTNDSTYTVR